MLRYVLVSVAVAGCYFYYNYRYFVFVGKMYGLDKVKRAVTLLSFVVNYAIFVSCSLFELHLVLNWLIFAVLLLGETILYSKKSDYRSDFVCALTGVLFGLTINIFCRAIIALIIAQPLANFDNNTLKDGNLKSVPVLFGFLITGIGMHVFDRSTLFARLRNRLGNKRDAAFLTCLLAVLFAFICLNLLLYYTESNSVLLKLWGIKSCLFAGFGFLIGVRYSLRVGEIAEYRKRNHTLKEAISESERKERNLKQLVYRDALTGLYNRKRALERIAELYGHESFRLCFADLDGLKTVNDKFGHAAGDRYLVKAARALESAGELFRYGGDEFLLLLPGISAADVEHRMRAANAALSAGRFDGETFHMSLSWGIAYSADYSDPRELLKAADKTMYEKKAARKAALMVDKVK